MKRKKKVISYSIIFIIMLYGHYFLNQKFNFGINCPFHYLTGLYCPGCGITRMLFSLITFNFYQAFRYNPLLFLLLLIYLLIKGYELVFQKKINLKSNYIVYPTLVIVILFGIIRNLPAFTYLLPTFIN